MPRESKENYIKSIAKMDWKSGHPFSSDENRRKGSRKMKVAHTDMRMNESFKGISKRRVKESRSFKENASDSDKIYIEVNCNTVTKNYPDFYKLDYMPDESVKAECDAFYREQVKALEAAGFKKGWTHVAFDPESGPSEHDFDNAYEYWTGTVADLRAATDEGLDLDSIRVYETVLGEPKESFNEEYGYPVLDFFDDEIVDVESLIWESNDYEPPIQESVKKNSKRFSEMIIDPDMSDEEILAAVRAERAKASKVKEPKVEKEPEQKESAKVKFGSEALEYAILSELIGKDSRGEEYIKHTEDFAECEIDDVNTHRDWYGSPNVVSVLVTTPSGFDEREPLDIECTRLVDKIDIEDDWDEDEVPNKNDYYRNMAYAHEFDSDAYCKACAEAFYKHYKVGDGELRDAIQEMLTDAVAAACYNSGNEEDKKYAEEKL